MRERNRMFLLILIMLTVCLVVTGITIYILYGTAIDGQRERLVVTAKSQARLIEAISRFDATYSRNYPQGPSEATLSQIKDAHKHYQGFGKTGEFTLAVREQDNIVFLLSHRHLDLDNPKPIPFDSGLAQPMRQALLGESGSLSGLDYRGMMVLAAYEPVAELNLGIVAKIDLTEIREPFVRAGAIAGGLGLFIVSLGTGLFLQISNPIIRNLKEEKEFNENILSAMVDTVFIFDAESGKPLRWNKAYNDISGYTDEEIGSNTTLAEFYDKDSFNRTRSAVETILVEGQAAIDLSLRTKGGQQIPMEFIASLVKKTNYIIAIGRDITERKRAERALQKERDTAQKYFDVAGVIMVVLDRDQRVLLINKKGCQLLECNESDIVGKNWPSNFVPETDRERIQSTLNEILSGNDEPSEYAVNNILTKNKNEKTIAWHNTVLRDENGAIVATLGSGEDVTERRRVQKELRKAHMELEKRVEERTKEVRSLSYKLLQAHEEERKRIAHDLHDSIGQSLVAIKMLLENTMGNFNQNEPERKALENIFSIFQTTIQETKLIIQNLRPPAIDSLGLIAAISSLCEHSSLNSHMHIKEKNNLSESDIPELLKIVIYRIFQEALSNVFKHSRAEAVLVSLNKRNGDLELTIEDNGIGFDETSRSSDNQMDTGIGLASMKERAQLSGGTFSVDSQKGLGTKIQAVWRC